MLYTRGKTCCSLVTLRPLLATSLMLALVILCTPVNSLANTPETLTYEGSAYGTSAFVGSTILVGQTAPITLGGVCGTPQQPVMVTGNSAGVNLPPDREWWGHQHHRLQFSEHGASDRRHSRH